MRKIKSQEEDHIDVVTRNEVINHLMNVYDLKVILDSFTREYSEEAGRIDTKSIALLDDFMSKWDVSPYAVVDDSVAGKVSKFTEKVFNDIFEFINEWETETDRIYNSFEIPD